MGIGIGQAKAMKTYKFKELSEEAQLKAAREYLEGWEETHDEGDLTLQEAFALCLIDTDARYTEKGVFLEDINV